MGLVYVAIVFIGSTVLQPVWRRESLRRPPTGSLALSSRDTNLDPPCRHLGVFLLAHEGDLGGADGVFLSEHMPMRVVTGFVPDSPP
jgi:hypothetical protein